MTTLGIIIALLIVLIGGGTELYIYLHQHGFHRTSAKFPVGNLTFWSLGDRVLIEEDEFRSGYECAKCDGEGTIPCDNCGGTSVTPTGKKCGLCIQGADGSATGRITCPTCNGKGGLLVVPEVSQRRPTSGVVVSAGHKCLTLKVGQSVLYSNFAGYVVDLNRTGKPITLRILHENEILCGMEGHLTLTNLRGKSDIAQFNN